LSPSDGLYERIAGLLRGPSERFPRCPDTYRISPAATVILGPALRRHLVNVKTTPAVLSGRVKAKSLFECVVIAAYAVGIEEECACEVLTAS
jgi:hypothetical protein